MALDRKIWALIATALILPAPVVYSQVFVVGEKTATADIATDFTHTDLPLPSTKMTERGRRELVRMLEAEQGFAHRALPMGGSGLTLQANGPLAPDPADYRKMIFEKGQAAAAGDRVIITSIEVKDNRIIFDINGGPYLKHRILRHIQFNDANLVPDTGEKATGARIVLAFEGFLPEVSAPEVKALLEPVIDFGVKTSDQAYADTLPPFLKDSIAAHDVLVGMNHRMVLAALGAPDSKLREQPSGDSNGGRYEEWIYGHVPQTIHFVRFVGDRVTVVEIAELGKAIEIHDKDEMAGYTSPDAIREIALGDQKPGNPEEGGRVVPPTLRQPGDAPAPNAPGKVQFPTAKPSTTSSTTTAPSTNSPTTPNPLM
jgi:hypothetical protein